jgi:aspartate ammonia-lyase
MGDGMKLKSLLYKILRISNDLNAIQSGPKAIGKRLIRKVILRSAGKISRKI